MKLNSPAAPRSHATLHMLFNTASLITNDMVNRAITFVIYALIARYLGAYEFGQMSITLTIFYLLQSLAPVGLKILLVRETSRNPAESGVYLVSGCFAALVTSILALGILLVFLAIMDYGEETVWIILLVSLGLVPYSLSAVCEAILQAHEKIRLITAANLPISLARGLLCFLLLAAGMSLRYIGVLFILSFTATFIWEWFLTTRHACRPVWKFDPGLIQNLIRPGAVFLGMQGAIAVTNSIVPLFLSKAGGEIQLGLFTAANQLMAPVLLVAQSTVMSLFPRMCQKFQSGARQFRMITERLIEILIALMLPLTIGLYFYAREGLLLLYEKEVFSYSALYLQIMVWTLLLRAITSVLGRVLMASGKEHRLLNIMVAEGVFTLLLCIYFVTRFHVMGAVIVVVVVSVLDLLLHLAAVSQIITRPRYLAALVKPVLAGGAMTAWLTLAVRWQVNLWISILIAAIIYSAVYLALAIAANGGWARLRQRYGME